MRRPPRVLGIVSVAVLWALADSSLGWAQEEAPTLSPEAARLVKQLDAQDPYTRQLAFLRLEALREPATAPIVRRSLESRDPDTRAFGVRALAAIEGQAAVAVLLERLVRDRHPRVRVSTLLALEPLQDPAILPIFIKKLRDRNREVRMAAVDAVSRVDQPEAREAIRRRWKRERDRDVRRVLEEAMKRMGQDG